MDVADFERLAVQVAAQWVARLRDETPENNLTWLRDTTTQEERDVLLWILGAAVPVDEPIRHLLAWCRPEFRSTGTVPPPVPGTKRRLQPCGTRGAAKRHRAAGEELCRPCRLAERAHNDEQRARRRLDQTATEEEEVVVGDG